MAHWFFIEKVQNIQKSIEHIPNSFESCQSIMKNRSCKLYMQHVTVQKVNKLIRGLKSGKCCGIDQIDSYSVKLAADIIDHPLHHTITLSIQQKKFPSSWKWSKIVPLHKKNSRLEKSNYRPVAILSPFSKILEKITYEQIYTYFSRNKLLHPDMHGFRQNRSTCTALLSMYNRWVSAASQGQVSGVVFLDLSSAFDLVSPEILIQKLKIYGLDEDYLEWIESYLTDRFQSVWIDHVYSSYQHCQIGVPQGSNLGPLFFMTFFNDLAYQLTCGVDNYADDTTLTVASSSVDVIEEKLSESCSQVSLWMRSNMLKLNACKTHILVVGTSQKLRTLPTSLKVVMDGLELSAVSSHECVLGCLVSADLKWNFHFESLLSKLKTRLNGLYHLKYVATFSTRKRLANGIFNSVLSYCLPLFGGTEIEHLKRLQTLQNKAASIVCGVPSGANRCYMFERLQWMTVNQLVQYHTLLTIFRIRSSKEPEYLAQSLTNDSRGGRIMLPRFALQISQRSFTYRGAVQWNNLPREMRNLDKIGEFKSRLKLWLHANVAKFLD